MLVVIDIYCEAINIINLINISITSNNYFYMVAKHLSGLFYERLNIQCNFINHNYHTVLFIFRTLSSCNFHPNLFYPNTKLPTSIIFSCQEFGFSLDSFFRLKWDWAVFVFPSLYFADIKCDARFLQLCPQSCRCSCCLHYSFVDGAGSFMCLGYFENVQWIEDTDVSLTY